MKNGNYILHRETEWAAEDKVIDFTAWKAEHLADLDETETGGLPASDPGQCESRRRIRRRHRRPAVDWAELAATLAVAVAFLALAARVLLF